MMNSTGEIWMTLAVHHIDMLTRIMEGYDHLGVVSTIDRHVGLVIVRGTEDTLPDIMTILSQLPFDCEIIPKPGV